MILAKNLPAGTLAAELQEIFSRFGSLGRVLLPEGGITAIVEFLEPLEARKAFRHLAYSKVCHGSRWGTRETPRARVGSRLAWASHSQALPKPTIPLGACCSEVDIAAVPGATS